ncbi:hypothetical protein [Paraflavitalea speifideaquila]|uniref:hypothetical protein n=1 Tax=Paraflavitalea speifideaquila TaxID=3076558 RepID=UPI0028E3B10D|nr:hypothetical protein [Paraflavitalea speifideiaquila]
MLDTRQYVAMRRETPGNNWQDPSRNPELVIWDTTRNQNLPELMLGNTAAITDVHLMASGGTKKIIFTWGWDTGSTTLYCRPTCPMNSCRPPSTTIES